MDDLVVRQMAERLFEVNMSKCGFSYSPAGIYRAAFDEQGRLYGNWEARMKSCKPGAHEYPDLYRSPVYKKGQRKNNTADEIKENPLAPAYAQNTGIPLKLPLNLRVDEDVSGYFEKFADEIGLSCNDLMNLFLRQAKTESLLPGFVEKINRRRKTAA
jgi:hypothetical protein